MKAPPAAVFHPRDGPLDAHPAAALEYAMPHLVSRAPPHYSRPHYHQQQQQPQQQFYYQQPHAYAFAGNSPATDDDAPARSSHSPSAWSSQTDSSGYPSPPSDAGANDWDLLSDMLMDDAVASAPTGPLLTGGGASASARFSPNFLKQEYAASSAQLEPLSNPVSFQQQRVMAITNAPPLLPTYSATGAGISFADTPIAALEVGGRRGDWQPPPAHSALYPVAGAFAPVTPPSRRARAASAAVKPEPVSADEQKKLRRRQQIATSVQRHREKKKSLVSALQLELAALTGQLARLRAQRRDQHASERLLELEERAVAQRRRRRQAEETSARLKQALFQQSTFLCGARALLGDLPAPRELEFHDWVHSYTRLTARDAAGRQREYAACLPASKVDLARRLVLRATDAMLARLDRARPFAATVRLLHDGSHEFTDEAAVAVPRELARECADPGAGLVAKTFTSVFLFEDTAAAASASPLAGARAGADLTPFYDVAWACVQQAGLFSPGAGYEARAQDVVAGSDARVLFALLAAELPTAESGDAPLTVEARVLCREQRDSDQSVFLWDYVDRDDLYPPLCASEVAGGEAALTRNVCGAVVVQRERGGLVSIRSTSVKMFVASPSTAAAALAGGGEDAAAALSRRLGLLATEAEHGQDKCTRFVYDAMVRAFAASSERGSSHSSVSM